MTTWSERILRWIVIGGVFLMPFIALVVVDSLFFPFITGKNFLFRAIIEAITFCYLALVLISPAYRPRRNWIFGCFLVFVIIMAIADAQGVNPFKSFWSNFERMDGWITIAHLFCYIVVAASVITTEKLWQRWFEISLGVTVFIDLWGFSQILGVLGSDQGGVAGLGDRIDATFGNPIYLAIYMLFHVFLAALLIYKIGKERWDLRERIIFPVALIIGLLYIAAAVSAGGSALTWTAVLLYIVILAAIVGLMFAERKYLYAFVIFMDTVALLFSGSRGAIIGLVVGAMLSWVLYAFLTPGARRMRSYVIGAVVAVVVLSGGLWLARGTAFVQDIGFLQRLSTISAGDTDVAARILNIEIAWKGIKERPILGWGQEEYAIVWDKFYDPRLYADEQWFDRVHNIIFDWWVAGGTLGLLAYLSVLCAYLWVLWRSRAFTLFERSLFTGLLVGYFIHNLTVFDNITSYIIFGTVLAYLVYRAGQADDLPRVPAWLVPRSAAPAVALGAGVLALGTIWFVNGSAYEQNVAILSALAQQPGGLSQNLSNFEQAISYGTFGEQEVREQLVQVASELASTPTSQVGTSTQEAFVNLAAQQMLLQEKAAPLDARFPLFLGTMLDSYGDYAQAQPQMQLAQQLSPDKQTILFEVGLNAEARGDTAGALSAFQNAFNLETDDLDSRLYYAAALIDAGDNAQAQAVLAPVLASGQAADPRIASAYAAKRDYADIITIWQAAVKADPTNAQNYFTLAAAYYAAGNSTEAIAQLQAAEAADPSSASEAEQIISEIKSGQVQLQ